MSLIRDNIMTEEGYTPYCGSGEYRVCGMPRTRFNGEQFECPGCGWKSGFDEEFIQQYRDKWILAEPDLSKPPCQGCGAMTEDEAETKCTCSGDNDNCHGCELWPD